MIHPFYCSHDEILGQCYKVSWQMLNRRQNLVVGKGLNSCPKLIELRVLSQLIFGFSLFSKWTPICVMELSLCENQQDIRYGTFFTYTPLRGDKILLFSTKYRIGQLLLHDIK